MSNWELPSYSRRQEPLAYIRGFGLDLTTLLVIVHVIAAIALTVALAAGYREKCYELFIFNTAGFWKGHFWTPLTDPFFHDLAVENVSFAVGLFFLWYFGRDLEVYLGRASFGLMYALLILVPVVTVLVSAKLLGGPPGIRVPYITVPVHYAIFIGYCVVYPGVVFFGIPFKWLGLAYSAVVVLAIVAIPAPVYLIPFFACIGTAYVYLHYCGANRLFDPFEWLENWKQDRALRRFEERQKQFVEEEEDFNETVNPILDKIAREGIQSLTSQEKQKLERARSQLLKREKPKRG